MFILQFIAAVAHLAVYGFLIGGVFLVIACMGRLK